MLGTGRDEQVKHRFEGHETILYNTVLVDTRHLSKSRECITKSESISQLWTLVNNNVLYTNV